jgi:hypothetical protein
MEAYWVLELPRRKLVLPRMKLELPRLNMTFLKIKLRPQYNTYSHLYKESSSQEGRYPTLVF